jgi:hypothetical protein
MPRRFACALLCAPLLACGQKTQPPPPPPPPPNIATTYRAIQGFSMGAIGSAALAAAHPEKFDAAAPLGGPLDAAFLMRTLDKFDLGGFCPLADLEGIAAQDPNALNDPKMIAQCSSRPPTVQYEHSQDFNHWVYTDNGANFDRSEYWHIFSDLTLSYGNMLYDNPASPYAPPGLDPAIAQNPPADICSNPIRIKGLRNLEYNPDGKYDAITFCDGQLPVYYCVQTQAIVDFCSDPANIAQPLDAQSAQIFADTYCLSQGGAATADKDNTPLLMLNFAGQVDPCRQATDPVSIALALDINGNGRRDYGEPVLSNAQERFEDVGVDGCPDAYEDGHGGCTPLANPNAVDPNHDNYDPDTNPLGTENDGLWEQGEPFHDDGLDGVPNTHDEGEGNGQFDMSAGRRRLLQYDARTALRAMDPAARARLNWLLDGGIRDVFNLGVMAKQVWGLINAYRPGAGYYRDFTQIPGMVDQFSGAYQPWGGPWKRVPSDLIVLYGKDNPTDQDRIAGDGDHVGTPDQTADRGYTMFNWIGAQWPSLPRPSTPLNGTPYASRSQITWYPSKVLGGKRDFGIVVPPGYDDPANQSARYPVAYLLHGYGMDPAGYITASLIADSYETDPSVQLRPMIFVFPSGNCCFVNSTTGAVDCREVDDNGNSIGSEPGMVRECYHGTFFINRVGYTGSDTRAYGDSFFELMDYVDANYRTLPAANVQAR